VRRPGRRALAGLAVLAVLAAGGAAAGLDGLVRSGTWRSPYGSADPLVVLAIGSDQGPPTRPGDPLRGLADGIHLFVVDTAQRRMTVVDIPRDAAIGGGKVNGHLAAGGPTRLESELEAWSGLAIDFWVLGSFLSVTALVDELGGVAVDVPQDMVDPFSGTDLRAGVQVLPSGQALAFARDRRSLPDGDIGRSRNQTRLLLGALHQLQQATPGDVARVVEVVGELRRHTASNIPPGEVLPLALLALELTPERIEHVTISGPFGFIGPASVVIPQPGDLFTRLQQGRIGPGA
jgi:polyisoprenyl-teichoic acid--peptidoglycan teichoic acid transferase